MGRCSFKFNKTILFENILNLNSSGCVNRFLENVTCTQSVQCLSPMVCSSYNICQCVSSYNYFNSASQSCIAQGTYLEACSIEYNCRVDFYLGCSNGQCNCISAYPTWSTGFNKCIVPGTYNDTCFATSDCSTNKFLVCNNGTSCSCPINLSAGRCDCPIRVTGNEMYWNGSTYTPVHNNTQSCLGDYMCQKQTQGTSCSGGTCKCSSTQFFNNIDFKCETLLIVNQTCLQSDACNSGLGLSCQFGLCKCNTTQFWKSTTQGCINFYNYGRGTCNNDDQCNNNLVCRTSSIIQACDCYSSNTPTIVGDCDCPAPVYGSEYYYNGSYCVPAKIINQTCSSSWQWQQKTQGLLCSFCTCASQYVWNGTSCMTCLNGWNYHRGSCFRISSVSTSSIHTISTGTLQSGCYNLASTRLAILYNSDASSSFTSAFTNDVYFDAYRISGGSTLFNSYFTSGFSISTSGVPNQYYLSVTTGATDLCARFVIGSINWTGFTYF
jgi:hypothetical protein